MHCIDAKNREFDFLDNFSQKELHVSFGTSQMSGNHIKTLFKTLLYNNS